jgi:hypothetical protein
MNNITIGVFHPRRTGIGRPRPLAGKIVSIASSPDFHPATRKLPRYTAAGIWPKDNWIEVVGADNVERERHALELKIDMFETKNIQCALVDAASPLLKSAFAQEAGCDDGPQMAS